MQISNIVALILLGLAAGTSIQGPNPVSRVVALLQELAKQVTADGEKETDAYNAFMCWGKSQIKTWEEENAKASQQVAADQTRKNSIESGALELTDERSRRTQEVGRLNDRKENAQAMRDKEHADFLVAEDEMTKAKTALTEAIGVMEKEGGVNCNRDQPQGPSLLSQAREQADELVSVSLAQREAQAESLKYATQLAAQVLDHADARFLRRLLTGDVPAEPRQLKRKGETGRDWKKLNRDSTFKEKYVVRSCRIMDVLNKLLATVSTNLKDAISKETDAKNAHDTQNGALEGLIDKETTALSLEAEENGAAGKETNSLGNNINTLEGQIASSKEAIKELKEDMDMKTMHYKKRQAAMAKELEGVNKAIEVLHNDDSRDNFKKSFSSQGFSFLQQRSGRRTRAGEAAAQILRAASKASKDGRLQTFAQLAENSEWFVEVIKAIDDMIADLQHEEQQELEKKEECEHDRASETREAIEMARTIDEHTDKINFHDSEMTRLDGEIKENLAAADTLTKERDAATNQRYNVENAAYKKSSSDDAIALADVQKAIKVLNDYFHPDGNLVQNTVDEKGGSEEDGQYNRNWEGKPATWDNEFTGRNTEANQIVSMLEMVEEDIQKDMKDETTAERQAQGEYDKYLIEVNGQINAKKTMAEVTLTQEYNGNKDDKGGEEMGRSMEKNALKEKLQSLHAAEPDCSFWTLNFELRTKNRQIEVEGLKKAKGVLQGSNFDAKEAPEKMYGKKFLQRDSA